MRDATLEEQKIIQENIDKVSKSTRVNFWELLEKYENEKLAEETQKYLNIPSCYRCIYEDKCPVYWHYGNAACITIFKNKLLKA